MKTTLKINRKGTFNTTPDQATEHQCVAKEHKSYAFDCQVQLLNPTLDQRGFIADHEEINTVIQQIAKGRIPSCELLAKALAEGVSKFLITREIHHEYVYIKLKANNHVALAWMEAWARPSEEDFIRSSTATTATVKSGSLTGDQATEALHAKKRYQVLSVEELRKLPQTYERETSSLYHRIHNGILIDADLKVLTRRATLTDDEAEEYKERVAKSRSYVPVKIGSIKYDIPLWAIVEVILEPEAKPVEAKKRYRFLLLSEVAQLTYQAEKAGEVRWYLKGEPVTSTNYMMGKEIFKANGRELSEAEVRRYLTAIEHGDKDFYTSAASVTLLWFVKELEEKPVEAKKRYRFLTFDEVKAITTLETGLEERWHLKDGFSRTSNYMTTNEINKANGRELTEKEVADYLKAKSEYENDFESEVGTVTYLWFVKELEEVPAEAPKPKLYRIKTVAEFDADPSITKTSSGWLHKDGQYFNVTQSWRMDTYHGLVLTEEQSRTLDNGSTFYLGTDWSEFGPGGTIAPWMVVPAETPIPKASTPVAKATWRFKTEEEFKADPDVTTVGHTEFYYTGDEKYNEKTFIPQMSFVFGKPVPTDRVAQFLDGTATVTINNREIGPSRADTSWHYAKWMITDKPMPVVEAPKPVWRMLTKAEVEVKHMSSGQLLRLEDIDQYGRILTDDEYKAIKTGLNSQHMGHTFHRGFSWAKDYAITSYDITSDPLPETKYRIRKYEDLEADTATYYKDKNGDIWTVDRRKGKHPYDTEMQDLGGRELTPREVEMLKSTGDVVLRNRYHDTYSVEEWMIEEYTG